MKLVLSGVSQSYGRTRVLDGFDIELDRGVIGLLGPNGSGKTTLLRTMATIMPPEAGTVVIDDVVVDSERRAQQARRQIGYLPQQLGFEPRMRLIDFVRYAAWIRDVPSERWDSSADDALGRVELTEHRRDHMRTLSGGMLQRAGIAWAVVGEPKLVLLDEPTVGLDPRQRLQFRKMIASLDASLVILSTHLVDDVAAICDKAVVLLEGSIKFAGTTAELADLARDELPGNSEFERAYMSLLPATDQHL